MGDGNSSLQASRHDLSEDKKRQKSTDDIVAYVLKKQKEHEGKRQK